MHLQVIFVAMQQLDFRFHGQLQSVKTLFNAWAGMIDNPFFQNSPVWMFGMKCAYPCSQTFAGFDARP